MGSVIHFFITMLSYQRLTATCFTKKKITKIIRYLLHRLVQQTLTVPACSRPDMRKRWHLNWITLQLLVPLNSFSSTKIPLNDSFIRNFIDFWTAFQHLIVNSISIPSSEKTSSYRNKETVINSIKSPVNTNQLYHYLKQTTLCPPLCCSSINYWWSGRRSYSHKFV